MVNMPLAQLSTLGRLPRVAFNLDTFTVTWWSKCRVCAIDQACDECVVFLTES